MCSFVQKRIWWNACQVEFHSDLDLRSVPKLQFATLKAQETGHCSNLTQNNLVPDKRKLTLDANWCWRQACCEILRGDVGQIRKKSNESVPLLRLQDIILNKIWRSRHPKFCWGTQHPLHHAHPPHTPRGWKSFASHVVCTLRPCRRTNFERCL